ncbi:MAG: BolA family transcriptional regulator [Burkholderiales bacterium]|nr:BolA family transcriptional regulator [Burkholderiales bacterium]
MARAIHERLAALEPESLELTDESGEHVGHEGAKSGGGHYRLTIVSPQFAGKGRVDRHRLVYGALAPLMQKEIHALAIEALAPDEI